MDDSLEESEDCFSQSPQASSSNFTILMSKDYDSQGNAIKILEKKIKQQQQLLDQKLYVIEQMKKSKNETERKTKNRIKYLKDQISKSETDIQNLYKDSQKWKKEFHLIKQMEENMKNENEKLTLKLQQNYTNVEEKENEILNLKTLIETLKLEKKETEEKNRRSNTNEDNIPTPIFQISDGVKERLKFFLSGDE
jgi:chromosome segregation ATPase